MAKVTVVIEDGTGIDGREGVNVEFVSADPAMPVKDGDLDFEAATPAQNLAYGAVMEIAGHANARYLLVKNEG
jgi:hypothetical protein